MPQKTVWNSCFKFLVQASNVFSTRKGRSLMLRPRNCSRPSHFRVSSIEGFHCIFRSGGQPLIQYTHIHIHVCVHVYKQTHVHKHNICVYIYTHSTYIMNTIITQQRYMIVFNIISHTSRFCVLVSFNCCNARFIAIHM